MPYSNGTQRVNEGSRFSGEMSLFKKLRAPLTIINLLKASESRLELLANVILLSLATINSSTVGTTLPPRVLYMSTIPSV